MGHRAGHYEAKGHAAYVCVCVVCVRAACACACVCESNMALKCRCGIISQSAKRCYQDFLGVEAKVFAVANQKQICKRQMPNGKWQVARGKWEGQRSSRTIQFNVKLNFVAI